MKLIIQIPAYNEEDTLAVTLADLPREVEGFDEVKWLLINDGSTDGTIEVAKKGGVDYIISQPRNRGLAEGFMTGLNACIALGADVIVNTDADNQYSAKDIPRLVAPIIAGKAEMVIGERPIKEIGHFSRIKKILQRLGSMAVRIASHTKVPDAPSGFRAVSRDAAARLMVYNNYTYTLETIIQAGQSGIQLAFVPIHVNPDLRPSRLVKSIPAYIKRSIFTILHIFIIYRPFLFFSMIGLGLFAAGFLIALRFLVYWLEGNGGGHVQSLILAAILMAGGGASWLMAVIGSLLSTNRRLLEDIRAKIILAGLNIRVPHLWQRQEKPTEIEDEDNQAAKL